MALSEADIQTALTDLNGWQHSNGMIHKTYDLPSYPAGIMFAAAVGTVAEALGHHPDMAIGYKKVTVAFTTHDDGNVVTQKDVDAAKAVEAIGYPA
jgi:4a-hydroxytetrahydrobiopterin dehydratase